VVHLFRRGRRGKVWDIRIYVLACDGRESARGARGSSAAQLKTDWESFSLDATTFTQRGVRYSSGAADPKIREIQSLHRAHGQPTSIVRAADHDFETRSAMGAVLYG